MEKKKGDRGDFVNKKLNVEVSTNAHLFSGGHSLTLKPRIQK